MAHRYLPVDRDLPALLPLNMYDWVPKDQVVWLVIDTVEQLATPELTARLAGGTRKTARGRDNVSWIGKWDIDLSAITSPVLLWYGSDDRLRAARAGEGPPRPGWSGRARYVPERRSHRGQSRSLTVSVSADPQVSQSAGDGATAPQTSQADSAGSIPVTRSDVNAQVSRYAGHGSLAC